MGGDEFCVLAPAAAEEAFGVVVRGTLALRERGEGFAISAAHGSVLLPEEAGDAPAALGVADRRMYAHKAGGRRSADEQSRDVLLRALEEHHPDLGDHVHHVGRLAEAVGRELGLTGIPLAHVRQAGDLHDVGKVAIPHAILGRPGPLDAEEWAFIERHTLIGERILSAAPALAPVGRLVRSSHERWDGRGYPDRLTGEAIPLGARIVAVCDAYDAMTSERPYKRRMTHAEAVAEVRRCAGAQFDAEVIEAFCRAVANLPAAREADALALAASSTGR